MCLIFIRTNPKPKVGEFRLIIASNRDEFLKRPAKTAFLCPESNIIGGRDLEQNRENGMWLGLKINENETNLRFGALLNVTGEDRDTGVQSRGFIVPSFLKSSKSSIDFFENLTKNAIFNAFNLVTLELNKNEVSTYFMSKYPDQRCKFTGEQTLGFGNSPVSRPYSKVTNGRMGFEEIIRTAETKEDLKERLVKLLKSSEKYLPDPELERRAPQNYTNLASIFVNVPKIYGTRTHSIILVDYNWNVEFYEETMESPINTDNITWTRNSIKCNL